LLHRRIESGRPENPSEMENEMTTSELKSHCNRCRQETSHVALFEKKKQVSEDIDGIGDIYWITTYRLLECCGCQDISLSKAVYFSEADDTQTHFYPPRVSRHKPAWHGDLPRDYEQLLAEVYSSLHADNRQLAMMGARALIDLFILRKVGDLGNFSVGMDALEKEGFISFKDRLVVKAAIEAGHAAAHRAYRPTATDVERVMDIVENIIQHDVLHESAKALRATTPVRQKTRNST